jgi:FkbM family methyltransferase
MIGMGAGRTKRHEAMLRAVSRLVSGPTRFFRLRLQGSNRRQLTRRIAKALLEVESPFFVKVGANDGVTEDPISSMLRADARYRGLLIEPVYYLFQKLKRNYSDVARFTCENVAIADEAGYKRFYFVDERATQFVPNLPLWYDQLGSFNRDHILRHLDGALKPYIIETDIECVGLRDVLRRNGAKKIDLLHIDTEGYDYHVLRQVDFLESAPRVILLEHRHLSKRDKKSTVTLLKRNRYRMYDCGSDYLAIRR